MSTIFDIKSESVDGIVSTVIDQTYWAIRRNIITGDHAPGSKLPIAVLSKRYGVSGGTIRESLSRLVTESLVESLQQRGFSVSLMSQRELKEITEARLLIEKEALKQSIELGDEQWESDLVSAFYLLNRFESSMDSWQAGGADEWEERNSVFHNALISACPSSWIKRIAQVLYHQWSRYCYRSITSAMTPQQLNEAHRELYDAALVRDAKTAVELLSKHVNETAEQLIHQFPITKRVNTIS